MGASARWRPEVAEHPKLVDVVLAVAVLLASLIAPGEENNRQLHLTPGAVALVVLACSALVVRRRWPVPVFVVTLVAALSYIFLVGVKSPVGLAVAIAGFTVAMSTGRRTVLWGCALTVVVGAGTATVLTGDGVLASLGLTVVVLLGFAIGEAVRNRLAYIAAIEERTIRAEQSREEEARRRVIEERLRIAHELHDVIAHHMALMNVQAGVAAHTLRDDPDEAEQALGHVRDGGRTVLRELTMLLDVLRDSEDGTLPTEPLPSIARLKGLVGSFTAAGLEVEWEPYDEPLPDAVDLVAYRVVQESLTNVFKHAPGARVRVALGRDGDRLAVDVTDDGGRLPAANHGGGMGSGHGLLGMRERVKAVGGTFRAGPRAEGGFAVHAVLPLGVDDEGGTGDDPGAAGRRPDPDPQRVPGAGVLGARSGGRC
jgi:signal transduction histidine kinase